MTDNKAWVSPDGKKILSELAYMLERRPAKYRLMDSDKAEANLTKMNDEFNRRIING